MDINKIVKTKTMQELLSENNESSAKEVFGKFLYEGELGILFGDSNTGKSILSNDIAFFVSGGGHEWEGMISPNIPSLYIDLEMTEQQFIHRYKHASKNIPDTYRRAGIDTLMCKEDKLYSVVKNEIISQQGEENPPKFIIIDNITNGFGSIFSPSKMRQLVSDFKVLKNRFGLTILLIAHCPKRKPNTPISDNNLGGSKMLLNFCDSAFAIAPSLVGSDFKYIKQIKTRETSKLNDVLTVKIVSDPYLSMKPYGWNEEDAHINPDNDTLWNVDLTPEKEIDLVRLLKSGELSFNEIGELLDMSTEDVRRYFFNM